MRAVQLFVVIVMLSILPLSIYDVPVAATEGSWQRVDYDYSGSFESLSGYTEWSLNQTRGPDDRWVVDLTISGYGFNPTAVLIGDADAYEHWHNTGSTSQFAFTEFVNTTLDATIDLTYQSQWHFVMNNTGPVTLYFTLMLIHYHWTTAPPNTNPPNFFSILGSMIGYFVIIAIIVVLIVPCFCGWGCPRRRRSRRRNPKDSQIHHHYTTYFVVSPDYLAPVEPLEEEDERILSL